MHHKLPDFNGKSEHTQPDLLGDAEKKSRQRWETPTLTVLDGKKDTLGTTTTPTTTTTPS